MLESVFILSVGLILYTYVGYPILLKLLPVKKPIVGQQEVLPHVSIIIAAYKGASDIVKKLDNTFESDYPAEKLQVIVITDGSDDGTDTLVETYGDNRVSLIRQVPRQGKTAAQKKGIATAAHDILIFTDLTTMLERESIKNLVQPLADREIGLVSSEDIWVSSDGSQTTSAQGAYVKYEMWLRNRESAVNSIVSASGCFYAVRKEFFEPIPDYLIDDTVIPMTVVQLGSRCIHNKTARSFVPMIPSPEREFVRRARMALGGINALAFKKQLLNPFVHGFFALQLWSHKLLRWLIPFFMLFAVVSNIVLVTQLPDSFWPWVLIAQGIFYAFALIGFLTRKISGTPKPVRLIYFFVSSNLALFYAWYQFFTNPRQTTWGESRATS